MTEPPRLCDDPAADEELRALVRGARPTRVMSPELRASLGARVTVIAATPVALIAAKGLTAWVWVGVAAVVVALGAGAWRAVSPRPAPRPTAPVRATPRRDESPDRASVSSPALPPTIASPPPTRVLSRPPAAPPRVRVAESPQGVFNLAVAPSPPPAPGPSATGAPVVAARTAARRIAEHRLLDDARGALSAGRIDDALMYVAAHEREFADGGMIEERELIAVEAHSRAGRRDEARARGERFLARWPGSLYAARVRALLGASVDFDMARDGGVHSPHGGP